MKKSDLQQKQKKIIIAVTLSVLVVGLLSVILWLCLKKDAPVESETERQAKEKGAKITSEEQKIIEAEASAQSQRDLENLTKLANEARIKYEESVLEFASAQRFANMSPEERKKAMLADKLNSELRSNVNMLAGGLFNERFDNEMCKIEVCVDALGKLSLKEQYGDDIATLVKAYKDIFDVKVPSDCLVDASNLSISERWESLIRLNYSQYMVTAENTRRNIGAFKTHAIALNNKLRDSIGSVQDLAKLEKEGDETTHAAELAELQKYADHVNFFDYQVEVVSSSLLNKMAYNLYVRGLEYVFKRDILSIGQEGIVAGVHALENQQREEAAKQTPPENLALLTQTKAGYQAAADLFGVMDACNAFTDHRQLSEDSLTEINRLSDDLNTAIKRVLDLGVSYEEKLNPLTEPAIMILRKAKSSVSLLSLQDSTFNQEISKAEATLNNEIFPKAGPAFTVLNLLIKVAQTKKETGGTRFKQLYAGAKYLKLQKDTIIEKITQARNDREKELEERKELALCNAESTDPKEKKKIAMLMKSVAALNSRSMKLCTLLKDISEIYYPEITWAFSEIGEKEEAIVELVNVINQVDRVISLRNSHLKAFKKLLAKQSADDEPTSSGVQTIDADFIEAMSVEAFAKKAETVPEIVTPAMGDPSVEAEAEEEPEVPKDLLNFEKIVEIEKRLKRVAVAMFRATFMYANNILRIDKPVLAFKKKFDISLCSEVHASKMALADPKTKLSEEHFGVAREGYREAFANAFNEGGEFDLNAAKEFVDDQLETIINGCNLHLGAKIKSGTETALPLGTENMMVQLEDQESPYEDFESPQERDRLKTQETDA